ncbi:hypothetical protein F8388_002127 [Cannabis sativa]|uniref:Guanine nucleotide-binding protein subunit gamma 3 n=1 Tax=Cannabis sativa TaxID=3483 RepID=A0A7J6EZ18_CANSA|nr:hypothetical protein F8388_002127 [Cannabis sativa]
MATPPPPRSSSMPSLPPPCPKSPPAYPDLYGKRRETAKVQMLEREIGFLQEELKSAERIQPASRCCKEYDLLLNFLVTKRTEGNAAHVVAGNGSVARYQNGVALVVHVRVLDQIAVKRSHATEVVAAYSLLLVVHALIAPLADANANANALVLHVYSHSYSDMDGNSNQSLMASISLMANGHILRRE